jgi:hypothetical protein
MCVIVCQSIGADMLGRSALSQMWQANPDGAGYMFAYEGILYVRKPYYKLRELVRAYTEEHKEYGAYSPFVLHFRVATHGSKNEENTHPHILANGEAGLVHNGILSFDPPMSADISDTVFFCRTVLAERATAQLTDDKFAGLLGEMIGPSNKLVIMDNAGNASIVNEGQGMWDGDNWFSNMYWKYRSAITTPYSCSYSQLPVHYAGNAKGSEDKNTGASLFGDTPSSDPDAWDDDYWRAHRHELDKSDPQEADYLEYLDETEQLRVMKEETDLNRQLDAEFAQKVADCPF